MEISELIPSSKLSKDLKISSKTLGKDEARFLVDTYYTMQDSRIRSANQVRSLTKSEEPNEVLAWFMGQFDSLEDQIKKALHEYAKGSQTGQWALSVLGIGPVIAAGLLAHIEIEKAPTVGHIWRFAGLDPTQVWNKKEKRPWNAKLKVLCWKIGESFVKFHNHEECFYGKVYAERKQLEISRNEQGLFAEQAQVALTKKKFDQKKDAFKIYSEGHLPKGHIEARARRYAVKLFLSHYHEKAYEFHFGEKPPKPYPISILGHAHYIAPQS